MKKFESSEMAEHAFKFWFGDHEHIRSPFPDYIQSQLKVLAAEAFQNWLDGLHVDAEEEIDDELIAEKFEQLLFEEALSLIQTEDERLSILYPFMPRIGDHLKNDNDEQSVVTDRHVKTEGDTSYMQIKCRNLESDTNWETSFELTI